MKSYPTVPRTTKKHYQGLKAHVFDKLDGSNLRFEWDRKKHWHKFGTRRRLFTAEDPLYGVAIQIFFQKYGEALEKRAIEEKWATITAFAEFFGPSSFAGQHEIEEEKELVFFDLSIHKKGFLLPELFMEYFSDLHIPHYFGEFDWTPEFVEQVRAQELEGITFEGVVGKAGTGAKRVMVKAKTQAWIDRVLEIYGEEEGQQIIMS